MVQDIKVEIELLRNTQTEIKLEMKSLGNQTKTTQFKTWKKRFFGAEDKVE